MTPPTLGLEEEVFVLFDGRPSTASLLDLATLLWRDPRRNFSGTASNFSRRLPSLMSTVEFSTGVHQHPTTLLGEVLERRRELTRVMRAGLIAPVGMLPDENPYNTAGLHLHLKVPEAHIERVYANLTRFLPVLVLASASSPWKGQSRYGHSYRLHSSFALGPLQADPLHRFQDLIITRRLGTIEIRALDPVWNEERLAAIVEAAWRIAALPWRQSLDRSKYNRLREVFPRQGATREILDLALELQDLTGFDPKWVEETEADRLADLAEREGHLMTWRTLDGAYRNGTFEASTTPHARPSKWRGAAGLALYYAPKLPFMAVKGWREHHARPPVNLSRGERLVHWESPVPDA